MRRDVGVTSVRREFYGFPGRGQEAGGKIRLPGGETWPRRSGKAGDGSFELTAMDGLRTVRGMAARFGFYLVVFVLGVLSMGFQLLASRLLSPHFGSSIIVWAWLISTFLAAFSVGSMLGGWISGLESSARQRGQNVGAVLAIVTLGFTAVWGRPVLGAVEIGFESVNTGLMVACAGLFFLPVTMLSSFGPQCVHHLAQGGTPPGRASGLVYGVSTLGNIAGVMLTAFAFIPHFRVSTLLYLWLGVAVVSLFVLVRMLRRAALGGKS